MPQSKPQRGRAAASRVYRFVAAIVHDKNNPDVRKIFEDAGEVLLRRIKDDYLTKHWGMTDSTGARWEPTKGFYVKGFMMVRTGDLYNSIKLDVRQNTLRIYADNIPYAKYALGKRPAWPLVGQLPKEWIRLFQQEVIKGLKALIDRRLKAQYRFRV